MNVIKERSSVKLETIDKILDYHIPSFQRLLNKEYIQSLCEDQLREYETFNSFSALQSITCALYIGKMYVLDGQHRIHMFKTLKEKNGVSLSKNIVPVITYYVDTLDELRDYYNRINKHNPINPLQLDDNWQKYKIFFEWFALTFKPYIKPTKNTRCPHFNLDEMMNHLNTFSSLHNVQNMNMFINSIILLNDFLITNREQIKNNQIQQDLSVNITKCYSKKNATYPCMLGLWRQYEWFDIALELYNNSNDECFLQSMSLSKYCKSRPVIDLNLKYAVWSKRNKNRDDPCCYCCEESLTFLNMECGHVVPHCKGGTIDIDNLEPICRNCNRRMGVMHLGHYRDSIKKSE
jgi:hypothetical protein|uniref:HNH nuclease domain-containing protein n=1 Tax=viral metagenome TaxID=1070528 RepID=A0A6C0BPM2_9ZZZZ